jgi:prepilin-type N-terminal cleavage/methylation domain-containing protein
MKVFSSDKGFTIVETMVAIAILAVGTLGVASMLMIHFSSDGYAARTRRAESVCLQKIEEIKAQKILLSDPLRHGSSADLSYAYKWDESNYQWLDPPYQVSGVRQLDVTVGWPIGGACTSATPENCKNRFAVTTYFKPLTGP